MASPEAKALSQYLADWELRFARYQELAPSEDPEREERIRTARDIYQRMLQSGYASAAA